jgi:DNA-binding FadR family transcriptional regulator
LIERFKVSPSVMNEALRILRDRDLVSVKPGANGGSSSPTPAAQVRLVGIDLWFRQLHVDTKTLFEARAHLEDLFVTVAMGRATPEDDRAIQWALEEMRTSAADPRSFLDASMRFHLAIARAARIDLLTAFYESILLMLGAALVRASYVEEGHAEMLHHTLEVHGGLADAIRDQDHVAMEKLLVLHRKDLVRASNPIRSPRVEHNRK